MTGTGAYRTKRPGLEALRDELGSAPPSAVAALPDEDLAVLAGALHDACRRQERAMAEAGDATLRQIPAIVRRPLRKLLGA